jgi:hypothetical protein
MDAAPFGAKNNEFIFPRLFFICFFPGDRPWLLMPMVSTLVFSSEIVIIMELIVDS